MPAPALQVGAALTGRSLLPRALIAAGVAVLGLLLLVAAPIALLSPRGGSGPEAVSDGIPVAFVPVYRESARAFHLDWLLLAAVHQQETGFSTNPTTYHGLNAAGCCAGPFQFNLTNGPPSTWDARKLAYRKGARPAQYPHPQAPHPSVYDDFDAAMAAGSLLRENGADATLGARTFQAVRAYNGAGPVAEAYARRVIDRARLWQTNSPPAPSNVAAPEIGPPSGVGELTWPVRGPITSPFCERRAWEACHPGIDIAVPTGTPILAAATGRVTARGPISGYGLYTCLQHRPPLQTCYAHQSRLGPTPSGGIVPRGALVGYVGCTGRCFGAHLHFEVRVNDQPVDPLPYLTATG
jgi:murein DD-endopeptidase MepM/ murein hydrolase activator NlpD